MNTNKTSWPTPPWDMETAAARLAFEENAWNSGDPQQIVSGYADNIEMRDGLDFINSKAELTGWLTGLFSNRQAYSVKLDLWGALKARMAVRFEARWQDSNLTRYQTYGVMVLQFDEQGRIEKRHASFNDTPIG